MLPKVMTKVSMGRCGCAPSAGLSQYRALVGDALVDELLELAVELKGLRIGHVNSTATGGGVAELLSRHLPLAQTLGVSVDWRLIRAHPEFFTVTKAFHNALQGAPYTPRDQDRALYLEVNEQSAKLLETEYDVIVVHDPQPAALRHFAGPRGARWIWRCHVDSSAPSAAVRDFLVPFIREYDRVVFTMAAFLLPGIAPERATFIAPAIDPLATKNMDLPVDVCRHAVRDAALDPGRPLLVQVSRFDPWKDPMGVIRAYRLVKEEVPDVQLALIGAMAGDDPEGWALLEQVQEESTQDPDLHVFTNLQGVGSMEVNVFQRAADVVIQKSLREGFGLVISEALWKERPVVAGRAGGIPMQFPAGFDRYLVESTEACASEVVELLRHPGARGDFGRAGREHVRRHFLLPRLLRDELRLFRDLM